VPPSYWAPPAARHRGSYPASARTRTPSSTHKETLVGIASPDISPVAILGPRMAQHRQHGALFASSTVMETRRAVDARAHGNCRRSHQ
jgi:hypothetical protein